MAKKRTWKLVKGIAMIVAAMCTPWVSFLSAGTITTIGIIMTVISCLGAGAMAVGLWADEELTGNKKPPADSLPPKKPEPNEPCGATEARPDPNAEHPTEPML